jgi:hypothetical protein
MLMSKCNCICAALYINSSWSSPNAMLVAYAIVKRPHDGLFICCMTFAYLYNKCSALIILVNNHMVSFGIFFFYHWCI